MNILVAEDEKNLAQAICQIIEDAGFNADAVYDGTTALSCARRGIYDGIILDVMLPSHDGFEIVRALRKEGNPVPILILTAKSETVDKVKGLEIGADDYMTKPFEADELVARVHALTRRQGEVVVEEASFVDLTLDLHTHDLSCGNRRVHLSKTEYQVMLMLMNNSNRIVSKQDLLTYVWGTANDTTENSPEAYVSFLRKKLARLDSSVQITTLRALGYRLETIDAASGDTQKSSIDRRMT